MRSILLFALLALAAVPHPGARASNSVCAADACAAEGSFSNGTCAYGSAGNFVAIDHASPAGRTDVDAGTLCVGGDWGGDHWSFRGEYASVSACDASGSCHSASATLWYVESTGTYPPCAYSVDAWADGAHRPFATTCSVRAPGVPPAVPAILP